MQRYITKVLIVIFSVLMLVSCGEAAPTENANIAMTSVVGTMVASYFGTLTALAPVASSTPKIKSTFIPLPTNTFIHTSATPLASSTFVRYTATLGSVTPTGTLTTATSNPDALAVGCNNLYFIRDVTIPAGTVLRKNQDFTKTWKVQNIGTCNWMYQFTLVPVSADTFGAGSTKIQKMVIPNNWSELSVQMTAPNKAGTYTGYWRLANGASLFGATLVVSFVVADAPTPTPVPTNTNTLAPAPTATPTATQAPTDTPTPTPTPTP